MKIIIKSDFAIRSLNLPASTKVGDTVEVTEQQLTDARLRLTEDYEEVPAAAWTKPAFTDISGTDDRPYGQRGMEVGTVIAIGEQDKTASFNGVSYNAFKRTDRENARPVSARTLIEGAVMHPNDVDGDCIKVEGATKTQQVESFLSKMTTGKLVIKKRFNEGRNADGRPQFSYIWANA